MVWNKHELFWHCLLLTVIITGSIEGLVVKFADGGPKKRQQTSNHGMIHLWITHYFSEPSKNNFAYNNVDLPKCYILFLRIFFNGISTQHAAADD